MIGALVLTHIEKRAERLVDSSKTPNELRLTQKKFIKLRKNPEN